MSWIMQKLCELSSSLLEFSAYEKSEAKNKKVALQSKAPLNLNFFPLSTWWKKLDSYLAKKKNSFYISWTIKTINLVLSVRSITTLI